MGLYGGESRVFPSPVDPGKKLYWKVDSETGVGELWEKKLPGQLHIKLGTKKPGEKFEINDPLLAAGIYEVFSEDQIKQFLKEENQKKLNDQAVKTAKDGCIAVNPGNKEACGARAEELLETGKATTPQDTSDTKVADETLSKLSQLLDVPNKKGSNIGITQEIGSTPLRYPLTLAENQDVIKFSMVTYKAKGLSTTGGSDRARIQSNSEVGQSVGSGNRQILGTVILPVPGQIQDTNRAEWSTDEANAGQLAAAALGGEAAGGGDVTKLFTDLSDSVVGNNKAVKGAITSKLIGNATGTNLLGRAGGMVINPNLELLFSKPSLREFSLSFRLSARSKKEGLEVIKIIRFFKQGMAPIRDESNLFLKAPNTFQVNYLLRGKSSDDHPFIGRMKECALTSVNTNYTPENNYATYEDGLMISYQISLTLKELEPVYNDSYKDIPTDAIGF